MSDTLTDIHDHTEALCDPRHHAEPRWEWDANRNKKPLPPHRIVVPGLIQQLRDAVEPSDNPDSGGPVASSTAGLLPGDITAISLLASIEHGSRLRCMQWQVTGRATAEECIRGLAAVAGRQPSEVQEQFRDELRGWQRQAEIVTGWRTPSRPLPAPCPACDAHGTLLARVDADSPSAVCVGCQERWDAGSVGILASHVTTYQRRVSADRALARAQAVEDRRRRSGVTRQAA